MTEQEHNQALLHELEVIKGKAGLAEYHGDKYVWDWLDHRISELKELLKKKSNDVGF